MSLTRPVHEMTEQLNKLFYGLNEEMGFPMSLRKDWPFFRQNKQTPWFPNVELRDTDKALLLRAEIPGIKAEDLNVEVNDNSVCISGESRQEKREEKENLFHSEFQYGSFYRRIALPAGVKADEAQAEYKNGILELTMPKQVVAQTKRIPITTK